MWNYVALASENPWMKEYDDLTFFNNKLQERRDKFEVLINSGKFFSMTKEEKEEVSPEVHALEWVPLHKAVAMTLSTMVQGGMWYEVNNFQREQFKKFGIASTQRMLFRGLQERDALFMQSILMLMAAGAMVDAYRQRAFNRDYSKKPTGQKIVDAFDRSGLGGIYSDINNAIERLGNNEIGLRPLLGAKKPYGTYRNRCSYCRCWCCRYVRQHIGRQTKCEGHTL